MAFGDFVQANTNFQGSSGSHTIAGANWSTNITANNMIVMFAKLDGTGITVGSLTSDSTPATFTKRLQVENATGNFTLVVWDGPVQAGGVKPTLTYTVSPNVQAWNTAYEYVGSSLTNFDVSASATGNDTAPNSGVTSTRGDATELQLGLVAASGGGMTVTAGSGFTKRNENDHIMGEDIVRTATGTQAADFTFSATRQWIMATLTYRDTVPAVPGGTYQLNYHR